MEALVENKRKQTSAKTTYGWLVLNRATYWLIRLSFYLFFSFLEKYYAKRVFIRRIGCEFFEYTHNIEQQCLGSCWPMVDSEVLAAIQLIKIIFFRHQAHKMMRDNIRIILSVFFKFCFTLIDCLDVLLLELFLHYKLFCPFFGSHVSCGF